jgi:molybdopterin-guanine dinucleotide biosynthesis protein A
LTQLLSTAAVPVRIVGRGAFLDRIPGRGPLGGILTALEITDTAKNLIVAVDLPLLTPNFLKMFRTRWEGSPGQILACKIGADYPLCLGVDRSLLSEISKRIGKSGTG